MGRRVSRSAVPESTVPSSGHAESQTGVTVTPGMASSGPSCSFSHSGGLDPLICSTSTPKGTADGGQNGFQPLGGGGHRAPLERAEPTSHPHQPPLPLGPCSENAAATPRKWDQDPKGFLIFIIYMPIPGKLGTVGMPVLPPTPAVPLSQTPLPQALISSWIWGGERSLCGGLSLNPIFTNPF